MWQMRSKEKDECGEDNPLFGYGSKETDYLYANKVVSAFENEYRGDVQNYLDLFGDILENYFTKDYLSTYDVYRNTNC